MEEFSFHIIDLTILNLQFYEGKGYTVRVSSLTERSKNDAWITAVPDKYLSVTVHRPRGCPDRGSCVR